MLLEGELRFLAMSMNNDTGSLQDKLINTMAADGFLSTSPASMVFIVQDDGGLVYHEQ